MKYNKFIYLVNIPYHVTHHVIGKNHTPKHRRIAGVIVMVFGVTIAHTFSHIGNMIIAILGDLVGYSIHATGYLPFVHEIEKNHNVPEENNIQEPKKNCELC